MILRFKEKIDLEIEICHLVDSYKVITVLYNIINSDLLVSNKEKKFNFSIVKCLAKPNTIIS